jgi:hypothetical protein
MEHIIGNRVGISGIVTVRRHPAGTIETIKALHAQGRHDEAQDLLNRGEVAVRQNNLVVDSANCGIDLLIQWLVSGLNTSIAYPIGPQWGEIGTGTNAAALSDTALQTPTLREPLSYAVDTSFNEAQLQFFFPDASLANGSYTEFGTFVSTSPSTGAGQLFNRALFASPYSKSGGNDTTVEVDFTISN